MSQNNCIIFCIIERPAAFQQKAAGLSIRKSAALLLLNSFDKRFFTRLADMQLSAVIKEERITLIPFYTAEIDKA